MKFGCKNYNNKIGVLIAQLGTPDAPTGKALRPYLKEFLSDRRVIEVPRIIWKPLLNGIILNTRPKKSAKLYKRIWTEEGSPLLVNTEKVVDKLQTLINQVHDDRHIEVGFGMCYGSHNIEEGIAKLVAEDCRRVIVFNMYPHYSATTVGANQDAVFRALMKYRWAPTVKFVEPYYNHPLYISTQAKIIEDYYSEKYPSQADRPEKLVLSYHGVPMKYVQRGDPYCCQCNVTTYCLRNQLRTFAKDEVIHTFQSRFGRDPWLQPYTDETIKDLAKAGHKRIAVVCPGFTSDCLETLDEIGNEAEEEFKEHGGEHLDLIPCLNDHPQWIKAIYQMISDEIKPWLTQESYEIHAGFACSCGLDKCTDPTFKKCGRCDCGK